MNKRRISLVLYFLCTIATFTSWSQQPNIIFIMADDLGYGELGCYGQEKIMTPRIDEMAEEGIRFTDFYAGSTVCAPSRCSLLTGKHTGHAHVRSNYEVGHWFSYLGQLPIPEDETTLFEILKQKEYATSCYGKWAMGNAVSTGAPEKHGVDDFLGYNCQRHAHSYYPYYLEGNLGYKHWQEGNSRKPNGKHYSHDIIAQKSLDFIEANKDTAFFLYIPFTIPHTPFEVPDTFPYTEKKDWNPKHRIHAAMITRMDKDIGRIIDLVKELGIDDNTIIFFTSDNGAHGEGGTKPFFQSTGPLRGYKRDLYEGGIRIPMIVRWPNKIKAGTVSNHVGAFWDIMPTFAELTGCDAPAEIDGISIVPELTGNEQAQHHHLYWEFYDRGGKQAIRKGKWKGVRTDIDNNFYTAKLQLFNLEEDLEEQNDVADQHPEIVKDLMGIMKSDHTPSEHFKFKSK